MSNLFRLFPIDGGAAGFGIDKAVRVCTYVYCTNRQW